MESIKVKLDNRELVVSKLPLKRYADLLKKINKLPTHISKLDEMDEGAIIEAIPMLLSGALPDIISLVVVATDLTQEDAENLGASEAVDVLEAIIKVNRFADIFKKVKKGMAQTKPETKLENPTGEEAQKPI